MQPAIRFSDSLNPAFRTYDRFFLGDGDGCSRLSTDPAEPLLSFIVVVPVAIAS
jgi:hypothetical protein